MDKSFIIRIYRPDKTSVNGVLEDVDHNRRFGFRNAKQLWSLVTNDCEQPEDNIIKPDEFNTSEIHTGEIQND